MVEVAGRPGVAGMAGTAIFTERATVRIVVCVTTAAILRHATEEPVGMTPGAGNRGMYAEQRECRQVMVKTHRFRP